MTASENNVDPFRLLVARRAEAAGTDPEKARKNAVDEAHKIIMSFVEKKAKFYFQGDADKYVREEAIQKVSMSFYQRCEMIYDGKKVPPETSWKGYIAATVWNAGHDIRKEERRHGVTELGDADIVVASLDAPDPTGSPVWASIPADDGTFAAVEHSALSQTYEADLSRQFSKLCAGVESGQLFCVFHPGRRCPHVSGRCCSQCKNLTIVLDAIGGSIISAESITRLLISRTGYHSNRQGHTLRRHVYRCKDWFIYLLFRDFSSRFEEDGSAFGRLSRGCVAQHLMSEGTDAPSETTLCILMNDYPDIPIPAQLMREHAPRHLQRTEGELR